MARKKLANKIYGSFGVVETGIKSKSRTTHENLISAAVASEFNTYRTWGSFNLAVDADPLTQDDFEDVDGNKQLKKPGDRKKVESTGVRSLFNRLHAVPLEAEAYAWRVSQNMPLLDSPKTRQKQRAMNACTVRDLVQKSQQGLLGTGVYSYSDFMFCKYLGRVPNNHLITLRRYTIPVNDYVKPYGNPAAINGNASTGSIIESTTTDTGGVPLGCLVTWLGTPGNDMSDIMKYSFNMPFKSVNSKFEDDGSPGGQARDKSSKGIIGGAFRKAYGNQAFQRVGNIVSPGLFNRRGGQCCSSPGPHYDANKAYSGVDMIKSIYVRDGEKGLSFSHKFKLTFDYELRSYDGINGKQAMLDLLGNILTVCYTTGDFWPGSYRHTAGGSSMQPMSSLECMKHHDTFSGYINAFEKDFVKLRGQVKEMSKDPIKTLLNLLDNLGGFLLGGNLEAAPAQMKNSVNALLSDAAVGFWHVTVGNPCAPMLSIGNLIMTNCTVEHYGPLGIDDFPTGLRVTCEFDSGKPRDKRLIERMYNSGNDRIYMPLDQTVFDVLEKAQAINQANAQGGGQNYKVKGGVVYSKDGRSMRGKANAGPSASPETTVQITQRANDASAAYESMLDGATVESVGGSAGNTRYDVMPFLQGANNMKRVFGTSSVRGVEWSAGETAEGAPSAADSKEPK